MFAIVLSPFTAIAANVWATTGTSDVYGTGVIKEADVIAGSNGVYSHLARSVTISVGATSGLTAYDKTSTNACTDTLLGDKTSPILPPFKMVIKNASTTIDVYRTVYDNPSGILEVASSTQGSLAFTSQLYEAVFFTVPNWTLTPSSAATLTVEIFTKGY